MEADPGKGNTYNLQESGSHMPQVICFVFFRCYTHRFGKHCCTPCSNAVAGDTAALHAAMRWPVSVSTLSCELQSHKALQYYTKDSLVSLT